MLSDEFLFGLEGPFLFLFSLVLFCGCSELGFRYGRRVAQRVSENAHGNVATIESALLGLLGLLLGFAFAMSIGRYDTRKQMILEEANDIETTFLRAQLLPERYRTECTRLLKEYLDSRIAFYKGGLNREETSRALDWSKVLQRRLWEQAVAAAREDSDEVKTGYFIESLNGVIDDHSKRVTAMENHVPVGILVLLFLVATMTVGATGYSLGLKNTRLTVLQSLLIVAVAATLLVIVDLDRPRRGLIRVSEQTLIDLKADLDQFPPPPAK